MGWVKETLPGGEKKKKKKKRVKIAIPKEVGL